MKTQRSQGLRRKARRAHKHADAAAAAGRVWDASQHRARARSLEAQAADEDDRAFLADGDLETVSSLSLYPRGWI